jgi:hypothetical protein
VQATVEADAANVPTAQSVQLEDADASDEGWYLPKGQPAQEVEPVEDWYFPAGQLEQLDDPVEDWNFPVAQLMQLLPPKIEYWPTAQLKHAETMAPTVVEYFPATHPTHPDAPELGW